MDKLSQETADIMAERFGKDSIIALATAADGIPHVRNVDAYYESGSFYIITYRLSNKMRQIAQNPVVAIAGDWFTAHGEGTDLGYFGNEENKELAQKLRTAFSEWIDNGHNDFSDKNTCILRVRLTDGVLFSHGRCYEIDFTE